jgi:hypothetical protein
MALYDGLPLDTPTMISETAEEEVWATRTENGGTVEYRPKPGSPAANKTTIETNLEQDLAAMQATIDTTNASINSNVAPHVKAMARAIRRLVRDALEDYSGDS